MVVRSHQRCMLLDGLMHDALRPETQGAAVSDRFAALSAALNVDDDLSSADHPC